MERAPASRALSLLLGVCRIDFIISSDIVSTYRLNLAYFTVILLARLPLTRI